MCVVEHPRASRDGVKKRALRRRHMRKPAARAIKSRLTRVTDWIALGRKSHYDAKQLAAMCRVSVRHLERHFKVSIGQSPQDWLNDERMQEAQRRIANGWSVKEAAFFLGFKQVSHFCRVFKQATGLTPTSFASKAIRNREAGKLSNRVAAR